MQMILSMMVLAALVFTAVRSADLPVGRVLHEVLIERPAAWLTPSRVRRMLVVTVLAVGVILAWAELAPVLAAFEFSPLLYFADMALYLDAVLLTVVAVAVVQAKSAGKFLLAKLRGVARRRVRHTGTRSSSPRRRKRPPPANDDAPGWAVGLAA